jgi:hypothetical protein
MAGDSKTLIMEYNTMSSSQVSESIFSWDSGWRIGINSSDFADSGDWLWAFA